MFGYRIARALAVAGACIFVSCARGVDLEFDPGGSRSPSGGAAGTTSHGGAGGLMRDAGYSGAAGSGGASGSDGAAGHDMDASFGGAGSAPDSARDTGTGVVDARNESSTGCNTCALKVLYECLQDGASVQEAVFSLKVVNSDMAAVALNSVTVRYWYTADSAAEQEAICDAAVPDCSAVEFHFGKLTPPRPRADTYVEITLKRTTMLAPGSDSGEIRARIRNANRDPYNQQNDHSFRSTGSFFVESPNITAYVSGKLAWGMEP